MKTLLKLSSALLLLSVLFLTSCEKSEIKPDQKTLDKELIQKQFRATLKN